MKIRKIPMRTCVVTREKLPKKELIRVVRTPEGNVIIDETVKLMVGSLFKKRKRSIFKS